jgi:hypothetical protein
VGRHSFQNGGLNLGAKSEPPFPNASGGRPIPRLESICEPKNAGTSGAVARALAPAGPEATCDEPALVARTVGSMPANSRVTAPAPGDNPFEPRTPEHCPPPPPPPPPPDARPAVPAAAPRHNLRTTAISLVECLERAGKMPLSALTHYVFSSVPQRPADRPASRPLQPLPPGDDPGPPPAAPKPEAILTPVERNIRRRLHDAITVICAVGLASRTSTKELVWNGRDHIVPTETAGPCRDGDAGLVLASPDGGQAAAPKPSPSPVEEESQLTHLPPPNIYPSFNVSSSCGPPGCGDAADDQGAMSDGDLDLAPDLALYTSSSPASPASAATERRRSSPPARATLRRLRASVAAKRARRRTLLGRIAALAALRNGKRQDVSQLSPPPGGTPAHSLAVPFLLLRGTPDCMLRSEDRRSLSISFRRTPRPPAILSETDVACLMSGAD